MKHIKLFEHFGGDRTFTGEEVAQHIIDLTPEESDVPTHFIEKLIKPREFKIMEVSFKDLMKSDPSFKEYIDSGEVRYDQDDMDPDTLKNEIVVVDGEVLDGYSRSAELIRQGENTTDAFVAI